MPNHYCSNELMYAERQVQHLLKLRREINEDLALERRNVRKQKQLKKLEGAK